eukprot:CAMPEP_0201558340 /NCGR_PEP_ID=MMETSP0173_2-20130828/67256_1 /ASSEMBLY_ACC=CAM_ASM_000268 /TAXON_ID=218659 /ORGANISM="Vexillifera sp., Strain DIVA3 564/2" /LENGTH=250 /DNA_ID=CAMNT_0047971695 /DNA_START=87 /DNA_END=835 /DNA_ORIENTATION=-
MTRMGITLVSAELNAMQMVLEYFEKPFDYWINLSGSAMPLRNIHAVESWLYQYGVEKGGVNFMEDICQLAWSPNDVIREHHNAAPEVKDNSHCDLLQNRMTEHVIDLGRPELNQPVHVNRERWFPHDYLPDAYLATSIGQTTFIVHKGAQWQMKHIDFVRYALYSSDARDLLVFFSSRNVPDESFFQTLIAYNPNKQFLLQTEGFPTAYVNWNCPDEERLGGHPCNLTMDVLKREHAHQFHFFIRKIKSS